MPRDVLLTHALESLPFGRRHAERLSREFQRFVERRSSLRRYMSAETHPPLVLLGTGAARFVDCGVERADGSRARSSDPERLGVALGDFEHRLGCTDTHLSTPDGGAQQWTTAQLPGEPDHSLSRPRGDPMRFPRIIADAREPEADDPVALCERGERVAEGDVDGALASRHPDQ